jgi:hypothetical protein
MFGNKTQAREWTASALSLSTARNVQYLAALAQVSDVSAAQKLSYWQSAHRLPGFAHTLEGRRSRHPHPEASQGRVREASNSHCTYPKARDGHVQSQALGAPDTVNTLKSFWQLWNERR